MPRFTWLGDSDPDAQVITFGEREFVKGEPVTVKEDDPAFAKLSTNPMFSQEANAEPVKADEAEQPEETGTEKAALKAALRERGEDVRGNPSVETLRDRLKKLTA